VTSAAAATLATAPNLQHQTPGRRGSRVRRRTVHSPHFETSSLQGRAMYPGNLTYEEFEALLEACWGVAVEALPLSRLQRHVVDRLKGTDPELAAKAAALYGDQFQRLGEEIKQTLHTEGGAQGQGGADAPF